MKEISIIVPCFNEEETIELFLSESFKVKDLLPNCVFEYIFVNDGSTDNTLSILRKLSSKFPHVHYLSFSRNFGKEAALLAGLKHSTGNYVAVMDADLQDPPDLLPEMINLIDNGYDIVGTRREDREGEPAIRSFFAKLFYKIINKVSETEMVDGARDFRLMSRQVVNSIIEIQEVNRFSKGIFSWVGYDTTYLSFKNRERVAGETSWSFQKLVKYSLEGFINFSEALLNLSIYSGITTFVISVIGILFIIVRKLTFGDSVNGWASLATIVLFMGSMELLSLGILGKYIAKIFLETKKRPTYFIKEKK